MPTRVRLRSKLRRKGHKKPCQDIQMTQFHTDVPSLKRVAVFDGVSFGPIPGGGLIAARIAKTVFCDHTPLEESAIRANGLLREQIAHRGFDVNDPTQCFATTALALDFDIENDVVHWLYIGDGIMLFIMQDGTILQPARKPNQDGPLRQELFRLRGQGLSVTEKRRAVESVIAESRYVANRPESGFSLMNGDPGMTEVMQSGTLVLSEVRQALIATDGLEFLPKHPHEDTTPRLIESLQAGFRLTDIHLQILRQFEDPHFHETWITEKRGPDDVAGIDVVVEQ